MYSRTDHVRPLASTMPPGHHRPFTTTQLPRGRHVRRHAAWCRASKFNGNLWRLKATKDDDASSGVHALAPSQPTTPLGEMASYYLSVQPHLFKETVDTQLYLLQQAQEEDEAREAAPPPAGSDLVLSHRVRQLRRVERRRAVEDLMYVCILARFRDLGIKLLGHVEEPITEDPSTLSALMEGVHSREAVELVKEHVLSLLGPVATASSTARVRMSKLQAAQVYAASSLFGYFLRRANVRFRLAKQLGDLPETPEETLARLERMVAAADEAPPGWAMPHPELPSTTMQLGSENDEQAASFDPDKPVDLNHEEIEVPQLPVKRPKNALRHYIESFDHQTLQTIARILTQEGAAIVERQTHALFGDVKALQHQMQEAIGTGVTSVDDLVQRVESAVAEQRVEMVNLSAATQRRAVLEAVAFGAFLRDVEDWVDGDYHLLTPHTGGSSGLGGVGGLGGDPPPPSPQSPSSGGPLTML